MLSIEKNLFYPIQKLSFDLRSSNLEKSKQALCILNKFNRSTSNINWHAIPHSQLLNILANIFRFNKWQDYKIYINKIRTDLNKSFLIHEKNAHERLEKEDVKAMQWYFYLISARPNFKSDKDFFKDYLNKRKNDFDRSMFSKKVIFGVSLDQILRNSIYLHPIDWLFFVDCRFIYTFSFGLNFRNGLFRNVSFNYSQLYSEVVEEGSDLMHCIFDSCELQEVNLKKSYMRQVIFYKSNLKNANFSSTNIPGGLFWQSNLRNCNFANSVLYDVSFRDSNLSGSNFTGAHMTIVDCRGANLQNTKGLDMKKIIIDEYTIL